MKQKLCFLLAALLGLLAVNLHVACTVSFGGEALEQRYSPAALRRGLRTANAAAEEILAEAIPAAHPRLRYALTLAPPEGESRRVADAALRATEGVAVYDGVFLNGRQLGAVKNGSRFSGRLQAWLYDTMPRGARHAGFSEEIALRPLYAREGTARDPGELLGAVTAMAHAWYTDGEGRAILG